MLVINMNYQNALINVKQAMRIYDMSTLFIDFVIHINIASIFSRYDFIHLFL